MRKLLTILIFSACLPAQVAHPRLWLDSANLTRLQALAAANDPTWVAQKAVADKYLTWAVPDLGYVGDAFLGTYTYVSGASGCTAGTQYVRFTNGGGTGAVGTITVATGATVPSGTVNMQSSDGYYPSIRFGTGYTSLPTQATIDTCTGTALFTASSGGTFSGTGTANIAFIPGVNAVPEAAGATGAITVTSGSPSPNITITNSGYGYYWDAQENSLASPITGTLSWGSGTGSASGTATVTTQVGNTQVCYTYPGSGGAGSQSTAQPNTVYYFYWGDDPWYNVLYADSLAYAVTGNAAYAAPVKAVLRAMVHAGSPAIYPDSGYPLRQLVPYAAIAYDWIYPTLSSSSDTLGVGSGNDISNLTGLFDSYYSWADANAYDWDNDWCDVTGNYYGAAYWGFAFVGIATEGDDSFSSTIQGNIAHRSSACMLPSIVSGTMQGNFQFEGWQYGPGSSERLFDTFWGIQTAGKASTLLAYGGSTFDYLAWGRKLAYTEVYNLRPASGFWRINAEGDWPNDTVGVGVTNASSSTGPDFLAFYLKWMLSGYIEGQYMSYLYANEVATGGSGATTAVTGTDAFLRNATVTPTNWTSLPPYYFSPGDNHTYVRSDWTPSAVQTIFTGKNRQGGGDHEEYDYGHISIWRGSDPLLVSSAEYLTPNSWDGNKTGFMYTSWEANTLFLGGSSPCPSGNSKYAGCVEQLVTPTAPIAPIAHLETANYVHSTINLSTSYGFGGVANGFPLAAYYRTFVNVNSGPTFMLDRVTPASPSTAVLKLFWHVPSGNGAAQGTSNGAYYNQTGSSRLYVSTLIPASPTIDWASDYDQWPTTAPAMYSKRLEVADPNENSQATTNFLTVLMPTASSVTTAPTTALINPTGWLGASFDDGTSPAVVLMRTAGDAVAGVSYSATYSGTARHVILNLTPGSYALTRNGSSIGSATAGADGSITFTAASGSFTVGAVPAPTISSLSPSSVTAGASGQTLTVNGANFDSSCAIAWNSTGLTTTYVGTTQCTAVVPNTLIATPGTASVTITTTGGGTSVATNFIVTAPFAPFTMGGKITLGGRQTH